MEKRINFKIFAGLFFFLFFIFSVSTISAWNFDSGATTSSTVTIISNGSDTNESTRFNTLAGTDCGAGNYAYGHDANGLVLCRADTTGAGSDTFAGNYSSNVNRSNIGDYEYYNGTTWNTAWNASGSGADTWQPNQTNYVNLTRLFGYSYYNSTDFDFNDYATHANVNANGSGGSDTFFGNYSSYLNYSMTMENDVFWNFANKGLNFSFNTPMADALDIEGLGAFSGDLVHIHQHDGNPSDSRLLSLHGEDVDVLPLDIISISTVAINISSGDIILNSGGLNATDWTNVSITESQVSDLTHTTDTVGANGTFAGANYSDNVNRSNIGTYGYYNSSNPPPSGGSDTFFGNYSSYVNFTWLYDFSYYNSTNFDFNDFATHSNVNANLSDDTVGQNATFIGSNYSTNINTSVLEGHGYYNGTTWDTSWNSSSIDTVGNNATFVGTNYSDNLNRSNIGDYGYYNGTTWDTSWNSSSVDTVGNNATFVGTNYSTNINTSNVANFDTVGQNSTWEGNYSNYRNKSDSYNQSQIDGNILSNVSGGSDTFAGNYSATVNKTYLNDQGFYNSSLVNGTEFEEQGSNLGLVYSWLKTTIENIAGNLTVFPSHENVDSNGSLQWHDQDLNTTDYVIFANVSTSNLTNNDFLCNATGICFSLTQLNFTDGIGAGNPTFVGTNYSTNVNTSNVGDFNTVGNNATFVGTNYSTNLNTSNGYTGDQIDTNIEGNASADGAPTFVGTNYSSNVNKSNIGDYEYYNGTTWNTAWNSSSVDTVGQNATFIGTNYSTNINTSNVANFDTVGQNSTWEGNYSNYRNKSDSYNQSQIDDNILTNVSGGSDTFAANYSSVINRTEMDERGYYNSSLTNSTQFEEEPDGRLSLLWSWFSSTFDTLLGTKTTDDLTEGSSNFYEQFNWNGNYTYYRNKSDSYNQSQIDDNILTNVSGGTDTWFGNYSIGVNTSNIGLFQLFVGTNYSTNINTSNFADLDTVGSNATFVGTNYSNNINTSNFHTTNASYVSLDYNNTGLVNISGNLLTEGNIIINQSSALCLNDPCTSNITNNGTHSIWN